MKKIILGLAILVTVAMVSCKKDNAGSVADSTSIQAAAVQTQSVAVAASRPASGDSIYIVHTCNANESRAVVDFSTLPATASDYLNTNYSGYTASKAYSISNSSGVVTGYIAAIQYNGNPVGVKFDATGAFVKVLEQREGHDLGSNGWHHGGCFDNRDGMHRDTVGLSSLPAAVQSYLSTNYPQDTLLHAFVKKSGDYVVISTNGGLYATVVTSAGAFVSHNALPAHEGHIASVAADALPAAVTSYLTTTYPGYVFDKAFSFTQGGTIKGYVVVIDADNTKYAALFDAGGNFVKVKVIP